MCARGGRGRGLCAGGEGAWGRGVVCLVAFGDVLIFHVIVRTHFSLDINCVSSPRALQRNLHVREEAWQEEASEGEEGRGDSFV